MAVKAILVCAQALLIQVVLARGPNRGIDNRIGAPFDLPGRSWPYKGLALDAWTTRGLACGSVNGITTSSSGGFSVTSSSAIPPSGVSILSDNIYEGLLSVIGELPFIGTAIVDGTVPTAGAGTINYSCGNGVTSMVSQGFGPGLRPAGSSRSHRYGACGRMF